MPLGLAFGLALLAERQVGEPVGQVQESRGGIADSLEMGELPIAALLERPLLAQEPGLIIGLLPLRLDIDQGERMSKAASNSLIASMPGSYGPGRRGY